MMTKWCAYSGGELRRWWTFHGTKCVQEIITHIIRQDCNESWYEWDPDSLIVISDREFFLQEEYGWYHFKRMVTTVFKRGDAVAFKQEDI